MENNYRVQRDLECCKNCTHSDTGDIDELICLSLHEYVDQIGICDTFELERRDNEG